MYSFSDRSSPGIFGALFGAVFSIILGALLAAVSLIAKPTEVVAEMPKEPVAGTQYLVQGRPGSGSSWQQKGLLLRQGGGPVSLTEADMNGWASAVFARPKQDPAAKNAPQKSFEFLPGVPNFNVIGEQLQVSVVHDIKALGNELALVVQMRGGFERAGDAWQYAPATAFIGALPLHRIPGAVPAFMSKLRTDGELPEELNAVLRRSTSIAIANEAMVVVMP